MPRVGDHLGRPSGSEAANRWALMGQKRSADPGIGESDLGRLLLHISDGILKLTGNRQQL